MKAKDVMTRFVVSVSPDTPVIEIAQQLIERGISAVPVLDGRGMIVGIVSEGDLLRRVEAGAGRRSSWLLAPVALPEDKATKNVKTHGLHAEDVMTRDVVTISENTPIDKIAALFKHRSIRCVPVVRGRKSVGIVSRANLLFGLNATEAMPAVNVDDDTIWDAMMIAIEAAGISTVLINAVVANRIVSIRGSVNSEGEFRALSIAAEGIPGVIAVKNRTSIMHCTRSYRRQLMGSPTTGRND